MLFWSMVIVLLPQLLSGCSRDSAESISYDDGRRIDIKKNYFDPDGGKNGEESKETGKSDKNKYYDYETILRYCNVSVKACRIACNKAEKNITKPWTCSCLEETWDKITACKNGCKNRKNPARDFVELCSKSWGGISIKCMLGMKACQEACSKVEFTDPPAICKCLTTPAGTECAAFCKKNFEHYKEICWIWYGVGTCKSHPQDDCKDACDGVWHKPIVDALQGNNQTHETLPTKGQKRNANVNKTKNSNATVITVNITYNAPMYFCNCFLHSEEAINLCDEFCNKHKKEFPNVCKGDITWGCKAQNATLKSCDAACNNGTPSWSPAEQPICNCVPKGRKQTCMVEGNVCDVDKKPVSFNEYTVCKIVEDIHEVYHNCSENTVLDCQNTCDIYTTHNSQEDPNMTYVPECVCLKNQDCTVLCQNETFGESALCQEFARNTSIIRDCKGENASFTHCRNTCRTYNTSESICACFPKEANMVSDQCKAFCKNNTDFAKLCGYIEEQGNVTTVCAASVSPFDDCAEACEAKTIPANETTLSQVCDCMGDNKIHSQECKTFCSSVENQNKYQNICEDANRDKINMTVKVISKSTKKGVTNAQVKITIKNKEGQKIEHTDAEGLCTFNEYHDELYDMEVTKVAYETLNVPGKKFGKDDFLNNPLVLTPLAIESCKTAIDQCQTDCKNLTPPSEQPEICKCMPKEKIHSTECQDVCKKIIDDYPMICNDALTEKTTLTVKVVNPYALDENSIGVDAATVNLRNVNTSKLTTQKTDAQGMTKWDQLVVGTTYNIEVRKSKFKTARKDKQTVTKEKTEIINLVPNAVEICKQKNKINQCKEECSSLTPKDRIVICVCVLNGTHSEECKAACEKELVANNFTEICKDSREDKMRITFHVKWGQIEHKDISGATIQIEEIGGAALKINRITDTQGKAVVDDFSNGTKYRLTVKASGYDDVYMENQTIGTIQYNSTDVTINMVKKMSEFEFNVLLTWQEVPKDLDLHLLTYDQNKKGICHTFYDSGNLAMEGVTESSCKSQGNSTLDMDNMDIGANPNKPETIHVTTRGKFLHFIYVYFMAPYNVPNNNESNTTYLSLSKAKIDIRGPGGENSTTVLEIPTKDKGDFRIWQVGCIDGNIGASSFEAVNNLTMINPITNATWTKPYDEYYNFGGDILQMTGNWMRSRDYNLERVIKYPC